MTRWTDVLRTAVHRKNRICWLAVPVRLGRASNRCRLHLPSTLPLCSTQFPVYVQIGSWLCPPPRPPPKNNRNSACWKLSQVRGRALGLARPLFQSSLVANIPHAKNWKFHDWISSLSQWEFSLITNEPTQVLAQTNSLCNHWLHVVLAEK